MVPLYFFSLLLLGNSCCCRVNNLQCTQFICCGCYDQPNHDQDRCWNCDANTLRYPCKDYKEECESVGGTFLPFHCNADNCGIVAQGGFNVLDFPGEIPGSDYSHGVTLKVSYAVNPGSSLVFYWNSVAVEGPFTADGEFSLNTFVGHEFKCKYSDGTSFLFVVSPTSASPQSWSKCANNPSLLKRSSEENILKIKVAAETKSAFKRAEQLRRSSRDLPRQDKKMEDRDDTEPGVCTKAVAGGFGIAA